MARDFFDSLESQLVDAAREGEVPRVKRVRRRVARVVSTPLAGAAIAVAASATAIAAGLTGPLSDHASHHAAAPRVAAIHHRQHHAGTGATVSSVSAARASSASATPLTTPGVIPAGGPVPGGFQPQSFTAISEYTWWLMGPAPCSSPPCTSIVRTVNGGHSFVGLHAPRSVHVSQLRFANEQDGFAFGPRLWVTHDGGETWRHESLGGSVDDLAAAGGYVYAIVGTGADYRLMRSPVGTDAWQRIGPHGHLYLAGLWVEATTVYIEVEKRHARHQFVYVSHNDGASFRHVGNAPPSIFCSFDATTGGVLWAPCATGMMSGIWRSTNGGHSFRIAMGPNRDRNQFTLPNSAVFGAASGRIAVVGSETLYRTTDGGVRWHRIKRMPTARQTAYVGFTDPTHGVVVERFGADYKRGWRLYYTTNAGASYHFVPITP